MALNCRVGDLAYVVSQGLTTTSLAGRFVIVERLAVDGEIIEGLILRTGGQVSWVCRPASGDALPWKNVWDTTVFQVKRRAIADIVLRPIRDPGDDAQDETLLCKPVPASNPKTPEPV